MDKPIYFDPEYRIGDKVALKINKERLMVVDAYTLYGTNDAGEVIFFSYTMYDTSGQSFVFKDIDLQLIERVEQC